MRLPLLLLALVAACVGAGAATAWPLLEHLGYAVLAVLALAAGITWSGGRHVGIDRSPLPAAIMVDEALPISYHVHKRGILPALQLSVEDVVTRERRIMWLKGHGDNTVTIARSIDTRGRHEIGAARVYAEDPFGIFRRRCAQLAPETVTVYPRPIPVPPIALPLASTQSSHHRWRLGDADATLGDLRPYRAGDPPSRVHWPSTARVGSLMVSDPETHRPLTVWLLVDLGDETQAERSAGIAAYLAGEVLDSGLRLGAIVAGRGMVSLRPNRGNQQKLAILDALATADASRQPQLGRLVRLATRLDNAGQLVIVSGVAATPEQTRTLGRMCGSVAYVATGSPEAA